jgi:hypothetical protein
MADGGGLGIARGKGTGGFIAEHKAVVGASLRAKATKSRYGRGMARVRRMGAVTCGRHIHPMA